MFGYVNGDKSLKGRIQVHHAWKEDGSELKESPILTVLGSPHTTFYPTYMQGFDKNSPCIRGYKRYPVKTPLKSQLIPDYEVMNMDKLKTAVRIGKEAKPYEFIRKENDKLIPRSKNEENNRVIKNYKTLSVLKPIDKNATFKGKITFFNLNKVELGALLSAMTFLDNNDCYHSIGSAKAMGFGAIQISDLEIELRTYPGMSPQDLSQNGKGVVQSLIENFKKFMNTKIPNYENCDRINELKLMAKDNEVMPDLAPPSFNKFQNWKTNWGCNRCSFPSFSEIINKKK
jgi:CRISPR-associated protein (TIGR03986 family)